MGPNKTTEDEHEVQIHKKALNTDDPDQGNNTDSSTLGSAASSVTVSSDLWSAAYREAVDSFGDNIDIAILKGKNVALLFRELEAIDKDATKESAFLRGVGYLRDLQVPLERFKLALDLASPLTSIEPTSAAVFGVVRGVTAVSSQWTIPPLRECDIENRGVLTYVNIGRDKLFDCGLGVCETNRRDVRANLLYRRL